MTGSSKILILGVGAVAAYFGASYILKLKRLSSELESVTKASIHNVSLSGIDLKIEVMLKNPSGGSIKVKHPFVKLLHGTTTIATSEIKNKDITVEKFSQVNLEPIMISIGFLSLATTVPALLKEYRDTGKLNLIVKTVTTINDSLPYSKTDNITLGGGKQA